MPIRIPVDDPLEEEIECDQVSVLKMLPIFQMNPQMGLFSSEKILRCSFLSQTPNGDSQFLHHPSGGSPTIKKPVSESRKKQGKNSLRKKSAKKRKVDSKLAILKPQKLG